MDNQRKMLSSGTAATRRSASVRSAGADRAVATPMLLVDGGAEDGTRIEIGFPADEPARHVGQRARVDDQAERLAGRIRNRDEHGVGPTPRENLLDLPRPPQD